MGPGFGKYAPGHRARGVEAEQVGFVAGGADFVMADDRPDRFALGEVIAEGRKRTVGVLGQLVGLESVAKQGNGSLGSPRITFAAPRENFLPHLRHKWREQFLVSRAAHFFGSRKPSLRRDEWRAG
jgi:hypothetical protein